MDGSRGQMWMANTSNRSDLGVFSKDHGAGSLVLDGSPSRSGCNSLRFLRLSTEMCDSLVLGR